MTDRKKYAYKYLADGDMDPEFAVSFTSGWPPADSRFVAENAAEKHHQDGDYDSWHNGARRFTILLPDGLMLGTFDVFLDYEPIFYATEIK